MSNTIETETKSKEISPGLAYLLEVLSKTPRADTSDLSISSSVPPRSLIIGERVLDELGGAGLVESLGIVQSYIEHWRAPMDVIHHDWSDLSLDVDLDLRSQADRLGGDLLIIRDCKENGFAVMTINKTAEVFRLKSSNMESSSDLTSASIGARP